MARITEKELILPTLHILNQKEKKQINTASLIKELEKLLSVGEEDQGIITGRNDSYFSQKVRNLKSHNTLVRKRFASYDKATGMFTLTKEGAEHLESSKENLDLIIQEETFLSQRAIVITDYFNEFKNSIENIKNLSSVDISSSAEVKQHFSNMLYSSVITSLETYLADALKFNLKHEDEFLIKFVETFKDFQSTKCDFNDIFDLCNTIDEKVEEALKSFLYHNLPKVKGIYKDTFNIDFKNISLLMSSISIRHDLVHRNGKKLNGDSHSLTNEQVIALCDTVSEFVTHIEEQFPKQNNA